MRTREECLELYKNIKNESDMRELSKNDLFFLMFGILKRADMNNDFIFERCREVQKNPDGYLDLWAREHYKSTIITVGLTIQNILNNPNITVGIFSHTRGIAKEFLKQIKREFENNELLYTLFPHVKRPPRQESRAWSEERLLVERTSNPKEATIEAWGLVDGQPIGKHFDLLIYDDVVTLDSVSTPEQIKKTTDAWRMSLNLGAHGGKKRLIGTRYHLLDTYHEIIEQGSVKVRLVPATIDGKEGGEPVFLTKESLEEKRRDMGAYIYSCQMLQDPQQEGMQTFKQEWLKYWIPNKEKLLTMNRRIYVDPANEKGKKNDYTTMWVLGKNVDNNYYVQFMMRDRLSLQERTQKIFSLVQTYQVRDVVYEKYGMQSDIDSIKAEMDRQSFHFNIIPVGGNMGKNDRIKRLETDFEQGRIMLPNSCNYMNYQGQMEDMTQTFIKSEYLIFPMVSHDDMLDCLARIHDADISLPNYEIRRSHTPKTSKQRVWG